MGNDTTRLLRHFQNYLEVSVQPDKKYEMRWKLIPRWKSQSLLSLGPFRIKIVPVEKSPKTTRTTKQKKIGWQIKHSRRWYQKKGGTVKPVPSPPSSLTPCLWSDLFFRRRCQTFRWRGLWCGSWHPQQAACRLTETTNGARNHPPQSEQKHQCEWGDGLLQQSAVDHLRSLCQRSEGPERNTWNWWGKNWGERRKKKEADEKGAIILLLLYCVKQSFNDLEK